MPSSRTKNCAICGKEFTKRPKKGWADFEKQKTCSPVCQGIAYTQRTVIPEYKTCGVCARKLPIAEFPVRPNGFPASPCNECKRVLNRVSYRRNGHKRGGFPSRDPMKRHARALLQSAV